MADGIPEAAALIGEQAADRTSEFNRVLKRSANHDWFRIRTGASVSKDINVVALVKGEERYIFLFNDQKRSETLRTLGRYASNSKLSFSWHDAAVLSQKVRNTVQKAKAESPALSDPRNEFPEVEDLFFND